MKLLLLLFFAVTYVRVQAQIKWSENRMLSWSDFDGPVDYSYHHSAQTHCFIKYTYHHRYINDTHLVTFKVESLFDPNISWSIREMQSSDVLKHEQLHFDINELYARKLLQALNAQTYTSNYKEEIKAIFGRIMDEAHDTQDRYDEETDHCRIKSKQQEWELNIKEQLQQMPHL